MLCIFAGQRCAGPASPGMVALPCSLPEQGCLFLVMIRLGSLAPRPAQPIESRCLTGYAKEVKAAAAPRVGVLPGIG